jgi:uncharacterized membrane protein
VSDAMPEVKVDIKNVRVEALLHRTRLQRLLSRTARFLSHPGFLIFEVVLHVGWVLLNVRLVPGVAAWDPYPFGLLGGLASIQALFIGLLILMHAEHEAHVAEIREEMELQVSLHAEHEVSKVLRMLTEVQAALGVRSNEQNAELRRMSRPVDPDHLMKATEQHIHDVEKEVE